MTGQAVPIHPLYSTGLLVSGTLVEGSEFALLTDIPDLSGYATESYVDSAIAAIPDGVTDHGALSGLADDDHTQYALANGSRGAVVVDLSGGENNENLLTPMPDTVNGVRNTINSAGISSVNSSTNVGAASSGAGNHIARTQCPTGSGSGSSLFNTHYTNDTFPGGTSIIVASVIGAYNQVCNSTGSSIVTAPHSYIKHSVGGHNNIFGGSTNLISGTSTRCQHLAGNNSVIHNSQYSTAINCQQTTFNGANRATAVACNGTTITGTSVLVVAAAGTTISGNNGITVGGVTYSGSLSICGGNVINHSSTGSLTVGVNLNNTQNYSALFGIDGNALSPESITLSGTRISSRGDVAFCIPIDGVSATTNQNQIISLIQFPAGVNCSGVMSVSLVGKIVGTNSVLAFVQNVAFRINAGVVNLIDSTGSGADLYRALTFNDTTLTWAAGNSGLVRLTASAQLLRIASPAFTNAATTVKWVGSAHITLTREDAI